MHIKKVLITGCAGFIGMHVANQLPSNKYEIVGIDNLNTYYDTELKKYRLNILKAKTGFRFQKLDICNEVKLAKLFAKEKFDVVIHLAAQAGVRYSLISPHTYVDANLRGTTNILEISKNFKLDHLLIASSSSVYGSLRNSKFSESSSTDSPVSFYAATKKANEVMAYAYSSLYNTPITCLRFFTVYGPAGRPDMAPWIFTESIINERKIKVYNNGLLKRDFTYIDDLVDAVEKLLVLPPIKTIDNPPYRILNIGSGRPISLIDFISYIEKACKKSANKEFVEMQRGDVLETFADNSQLKKLIDFKPKTDIELGISHFVTWFKEWKN